jgi:hypothetical protein
MYKKLLNASYDMVVHCTNEDHGQLLYGLSPMVKGFMFIFDLEFNSFKGD